MRIRPKFDDDGDLQLIASTYSSSEFAALHDVLEKLGIIMVRNPTRRDRKGRGVREYNVPRRSVRTFEHLLGGYFENDGSFTPSIPRFGAKGKRYACREITPAGRRGECEEMLATSDSIAVVKC